MPIPLFTTEKPNTAETQPSATTNNPGVTSTPLTSGSTLSERRRSSASEEQHPRLLAATATSPASSGSERTREEREEADRLYEERMEDEYAKREGGA